MKPESDAWLALHEHAGSLLRPGFAERALRAARAVAPTFYSQCVLSAATAMVCLLVIFFVHARITADETARNLAGWQEIAAETEQLSLLQ
jgi:hypothetical protein